MVQVCALAMRPPSTGVNVHLSLYNYPLLGMVDTGADKSYMGGRAVRFLSTNSLNPSVSKLTSPQRK
jgi:hypothetical protein